MDGVLADESESYREAIRKTAEELSGERVQKKDVDELKKAPGFNNDWDAAFRLVRLISGGVRRESFAGTAPLSEEERKSAEYGRVMRLFQKNYFQFRNCEKLLVDRKQLEKVADAGLKQAIATGRPRKEALWFLEKEGLLETFPPEMVVAKEDAEREKPDPAPLLEAIKRMGVKRPVYVGDTINDALAAKAAGMPVIMVGRRTGVSGEIFVGKPENVFEVLLK